MRPVQIVTYTPRSFAARSAALLRSGIFPALSSSVPSRSVAMSLIEDIYRFPLSSLPLKSNIIVHDRCAKVKGGNRRPSPSHSTTDQHEELAQHRRRAQNVAVGAAERTVRPKGEPDAVKSYVQFFH